VAFQQVKKSDRAWLKAMLLKVGLRPSQWTCNTYKVQEHLHITDKTGSPSSRRSSAVSY